MPLGWLGYVILYIAGVIHIIIAVVLIGAAFGAWFGARWLFKKIDTLTTKQVRPALAKVHTQALKVQDKTSRLPGNTPMPEGSVPSSGRKLPSLKNLPFVKKKRKRFLVV